MKQEKATSEKLVVLSGMRPTGELHLGHFEGVLRNWVKLQETHDCYYFVADWHAITTELDTKNIGRYSLDMVADWLAFGVNPDMATLFVQSCVPEHAELSLILERLVNKGTMERLPTFKGYVEHLAGDRKIWDQEGKRILEGDERLEAVAKAEVSLGFVAYPILQAADILLYNTTQVPVGEDQLPHIELTRDLAQRFNHLYGEVFVIPEALLGEAKRIRGSDGRKMSKSYGNSIEPHYSREEIANRVKQTVTARPRLKDKGDPFECPVYDLHRIFNQEREIELNKNCRDASIRCYDCKMELPEKIAAAYEQFREQRTKITDDYVKDVLREGNLHAREVAAETLDRVKRFMLMDYLEAKK